MEEPQVNFDDGERLKLMKIIEKEVSVFIPFRSSKMFEYPEFGNTKKIRYSLNQSLKHNFQLSLTYVTLTTKFSIVK